MISGGIFLGGKEKLNRCRVKAHTPGFQPLFRKTCLTGGGRARQVSGIGAFKGIVWMARKIIGGGPWLMKKKGAFTAGFMPVVGAEIRWPVATPLAFDHAPYSAVCAIAEKVGPQTQKKNTAKEKKNRQCKNLMCPFALISTRHQLDQGAGMGILHPPKTAGFFPGNGISGPPRWQKA